MSQEKIEGKSTSYSICTNNLILTIRQCDGKRSSCARCAKGKVACKYDVEPETLRYESIQGKNATLQIERDLLYRLITYMSSRSVIEAQEAFRRLRTGHDPFEVAKSLST
jgi:hypothetical protein